MRIHRVVVSRNDHEKSLKDRVLRRVGHEALKVLVEDSQPVMQGVVVETALD